LRPRPRSRAPAPRRHRPCRRRLGRARLRSARPRTARHRRRWPGCRAGRPAAAGTGRVRVRRALRLERAPRRRRDGRGLSGLRVDLSRIYLLQAVRAVAYGFGSVILGVSLAHSGLSSTQVGLVLASLLAGSALASLLLVRRADRLGRRRVYRLLYALMAVAGTIFALTSSLPWLILAGLTGTLSVDVQESGPFTSLEQAMIPEVAGARTTHAFGRYNAVAALAGAGGALLAGGPT